MDELLHHCLRELAFDGDLGCDVSRLTDFIKDFYAHSTQSANQKIDDAFCAFVWSLVIQQPTVLVGTIPPGITSQVWIAPQVSAKRKASARGEILVVPTQPSALDLVPDAKSRPLAELQREYGSMLRIAGDRDSIYSAVTGTHIRFSKMSPMVYSALQIITRGRYEGVTVVKLGQETKYDQKTCFYLVKQLTDLNLVVKVRRGGVGTHFVIHRYFFERSDSWKAIRDEELRAELASKNPTTSGASSHPQEEEEEKESPTATSLGFTPIDARHLSSLPLVRGRVVKLLKASTNNIHVASNMLVTIGFAHPTKTDRRFFQRRIQELIQQGVIEKVVVPSKKKRSNVATVLCLRLVNENVADGDGAVVVVVPPTQEDEEQEYDLDLGGFKANVTIHKQISDLLEEAGTTGMTLSELSSALCQFDRRTIELILTRVEKFHPPPHLGDIGVAALLENNGRERRHRYFTVSAYRALVEQENLDKSTAGYADVDFDNVGGFAHIDAAGFYKDEEELYHYQDSFKDDDPAKLVKAAKKATKAVARDTAKPRRKRKAEEAGGDAVNDTNAPISARPAKKRKVKFSEDAGAEATGATEGNAFFSLKRGPPVVDDTDPQIPKKRGRPPKAKPDEPPKKRGRPRKHPVPVVVDANETAGGSGSGAGAQTSNEPARLRRSARASTRKSLMEFGEDVDEAEAGHHEGGEVVDQLDRDEVHLGRDKGAEGESVRDGDEGKPRPVPEFIAEPSLSSLPLSTFVSHDQSNGGGEDPPAEKDSDVSSAMPAGGQQEATTPRPQGGAIGVDTMVGNEEPHSYPDEDILMTEVDETVRVASSTTVEDRETSQVTIGEQLPPSGGLLASKEHPDGMTVENQDVDADVDAHSTQNSNALAGPYSASTPRHEAARSTSKGVTPRPKINVSNLRRENELLRCLEMLGGIVNIQTKEIYDTHSALLETLAKAGEPASSPPGTRTDKRTVTAMFNSMESRGKVKQLTTTVPMYIGTTRQTVIAYLPHVTDAQMSVFLSNLSTTNNLPPITPQPLGRVIEEAVGYGQVSRRSSVRKLAPIKKLEKATDGPESWQKNTERADEIFSGEESAIRDVLLTERSTLHQAYHTIIPKCVRAREVHLISLHAFETAHPSSHIASHQHKVLHLSFLSLDLPLRQYCKLVSPTVHSEALLELVVSAHGTNTAVKDLPDNIKDILQVKKARPSAKLLDSLEILQALGLVTPLTTSESDSPAFICEAKDGHPAAFNIAPVGWTPQTPSSAPTYWKFNEVAPVHHWAKSATDPPFLRDVLVGSVSGAVTYWDLLENTCLNQTMEPLNQAVSNTPPLNISRGTARTLRHRVSWSTWYKLSWLQMQYLNRFYNIATGITPLDSDSESGDTQIDKISWVISAPREVVREYYTDIQGKLTKETEKARKRLKREAKEKVTLQAAEAQASLRKKAEDAHQRREEEWTQLLQRVHPEAIKKSVSLRIKQIHDRFGQSTSVQDIQKWEAEIAAAIQESELMSKKVWKAKKTSTAKGSSVASSSQIAAPLSNVVPPVAMNPPERSIVELISEQGPRLDHSRPPRKQRKKRAKDDPPEDNDNRPRPITRRQRFMWTQEYEELARDAAAIVKARCRDAVRLDWGAFEQVFPAVPRNTVRQRVAHLREATGGDTYLNRLEESWYHIWVQHRGSEHLPDPDPSSATNFDLIKHIEFLRKHIDKNALRVGYLPAQQHAQPAIPSDISSIFEQFDVIDNTPSAPTWDFVWNALVEEGRERGMLGLPFTSHQDELPLEDSSSEEMCLAEATLKMVLGTPNEVYEPDAASALLSSVGEGNVPVAAANLLGRGVLSKLVRDPQKSQPGRLLKISEVNQNALNGVINRDTFQDAAALEELSAQEEDWRAWPLLASDGDMATLIQLVSDNKVDFNIDTSHPQACRVTLDWNSKKADDDQIETDLNFRFFGLSDAASNSNDGENLESLDGENPIVDIVENPAVKHGITVNGQPACCRKEISDAVVDCSGCLDELWQARSSHFNAQELTTAQLILWLVAQAGMKGVSKQDLIMNTKLEPDHVLSMVSEMTSDPHPFLHWVGYNTTLLVSSAHARSWTVALSSSPLIRVFPRRWLDIFGEKVSDVWEAALRAIVGTIIFRPGISQTELRWRLKSVYDKQEVMELLRTLLDANFIKNHFVSPLAVLGAVESRAISALDEKEEGRLFWFLNDAKHWYAI
ncbi:hypothetical protein D9757_006233 [Collybiopsis confluens]|uniref:Uncharacterized protein n=1 Tax=Collybiopsis confluens TaxID=2823264 RepID=A0A8H5HKL6_9AGAR|nr:hypothetical protein D9757_006233 [Collybiopsis confluens]